MTIQIQRLGLAQHGLTQLDVFDSSRLLVNSYL